MRCHCSPYCHFTSLLFYMRKRLTFFNSKRFDIRIKASNNLVKGYFIKGFRRNCVSLKNSSDEIFVKVNVCNYG